MEDTDYMVGKVRVRIVQDDDPQNPRKEWDNVGKMVCWHRRYELGDEQPSQSPEEYFNAMADDLLGDIPERVEEALNYFDHYSNDRSGSEWYRAAERYLDRKRVEALNASIVKLPLGLYDHSGITMYVGGAHPFDTGGWDSGQVGVIYCSLEKAQYEWGTEDSKARGWDGEASYTKKDDGTTRTLREAAESYLEGEVKTYDQYLTGQVYGYIIEDGNGDQLDSCWGFYDDYNLKYVKETAESAAKYQNAQLRKAKREEAKARKHERALAFDAACRDVVTA